MSLINKMLQDLDARGTPAAAEAYAPQIQPVGSMRRAPSLRVLAAAVGGSAAGVALAWLAWQHWVQRAPVAAPAAPAVLAKPAPAPVPAAPVPVVVPAPAAPAVALQAEQGTQPPAAAPAGKDVAPLEPDSQEARALRRALAATLAEREEAATAALRAPAAPVGEKPPKKAKDKAATAHDKPRERAQDKARDKSRDKAVIKAGDKAADKAQPKTGREAAVPGRQDAGAQRGFQRAEGAYRRALASLQEGRMGETVAALEEAVRIEPRHEAARQTLVGLLIEAGRGDEAMRQLQLGLAQDARQPALAMLLARLQIERGASGIETLVRTLPYAGNNPDYHAFLAGALQRQQRHREAAEHYGAALRGAPANGVWWMGMGISLQAEKRDGEALEAFRKARASGTLSQELTGFVERRVQQLER